MKIVNKIDDDTLNIFGYRKQWLEQLIKEVINQARLECKEVIIWDFEHSESIFLAIDGKEYNIRTWNFHPMKRDENNNVCAEMVDYTLYEMIKDKNGGHGNEISNGMVRVTWKN